MVLKIKKCLLCGSEFESTHWNQTYCCLEHRDEYRRHHRQQVYSVKYASKSPRSFLSRLLHKRRYLKADLDLNYLESIYNEQKGLCALSKQPMTFTHGEGLLPTNISIDKINPEHGYTKGNIQLLCRIVNTMKYTLSKEELFDWCQKILVANNHSIVPSSS